MIDDDVHVEGTSDDLMMKMAMTHDNLASSLVHEQDRVSRVGTFRKNNLVNIYIQ
jgi:hypothetical protein